MRTNRTWAIGLPLGVTAFLFFLSLHLGPANLAWSEVWEVLKGGGIDLHRAIVEVRLTRALLAILVGASLGFAGVIFQGLFRNPLADPFVLGTSGGAALGAVSALVCGVGSGFLALGGTTIAAFAGALLATGLAWQLSRGGGLERLLLAGFAVGSFSASMVSALLLLGTRNWNEVLLWLFGNLEREPMILRLQIGVPLFVVSMGAATFFARELNVMLLGEEPARQLGVEVEKVRRTLLFLGTLAVASAVSLCGIIGFVGLIVPHVVRRALGPDHRTLLPAAALTGGGFLLACDLVGRLAFPPSGLPVGVVTALVGAPFFLFILGNPARRRPASPFSS